MTLMNRNFKIVLILLFLPAISFAGQNKVTMVTDGDTIKVINSGSVSTIRLVGIDAPETSMRCK